MMTSSEVTEVGQDLIPASTGQVPVGFTQVGNPMSKSMQQSER